MYGCENVLHYLWRWTTIPERLVLLGLALMLARTIFIAVRASHGCHVGRRFQVSNNTGPSPRKNLERLAADLQIQTSNLKSIAVAAPYLGLAGTCLGILGAFREYVGSKLGLIVMVASGVDAALLSTAAGLLVAI